MDPSIQRQLSVGSRRAESEACEASLMGLYRTYRTYRTWREAPSFRRTTKSGNDAATVGSVLLDGRLRSGLQWASVASSTTPCRHLSQNVSLAANVPHFPTDIIEHMSVYLMRYLEINEEATTCTSHQVIHNNTVDFNRGLFQ